MKRTLATLLAVGALAVAGAAAAQSMDERIDRIEQRIDRGLDDRTLTDYQAEQLRAQLNNVRRTRDTMLAAGDMTDWRRDSLNSRLDHIAYLVSRDRYFARYGTYRGYRSGWDEDDDGY